jgi:hypothetical protein
MIHPGLAALEKWEPIEYAAGYRARLVHWVDSAAALLVFPILPIEGRRALRGGSCRCC